MRYSEFRISRFVLLMAVVALFIGFALHSFAQEDTGTFSGRVVDMDGNPVRDLPVFIAPLNSGAGGHYWPVLLPHEFTQLRRAQTDPDGRFSITGIPPDSVYFGALPYNIDERLPNDFEDIVDDFVSRDWTEITENDIEAFVSSNFGMDQGDFEPDIEIVSLRIRRLTFYRRNDQDEIAFGVKPGVHIKNVEVKVQPRMRVRGRILFKDGTSLSKTRVRLHFRAYNVDGTGTRQSGGEPRTDAEGYFIIRPYNDLTERCQITPRWSRKLCNPQQVSITTAQLIFYTRNRRNGGLFSFSSTVSSRPLGGWIFIPGRPLKPRILI